MENQSSIFIKTMMVDVMLNVVCEFMLWDVYAILDIASSKVFVSYINDSKSQGDVCSLIMFASMCGSM